MYACGDPGVRSDMICLLAFGAVAYQCGVGAVLYPCGSGCCIFSWPAGLRGPAIIIDEKNGLTVISTLGNVVGYSGDGNASGPRHKEQRTTIRDGCQETGDCP